MTDAERLVAEHACEKLMRQFANLNDARDFTGLAALFAEDARYARPTDPDRWVEGRAAIQAAFEGRPATKLTRHIVSNAVVTVEGPTEASGVSYVTLSAGPAVESGLVKADPALIGAFHDRYVKLDGRWLFQQRKGSVVMTMAG
jgi:ketosteroid isomerase-like protein